MQIHGAPSMERPGNASALSCGALLALHSLIPVQTDSIGSSSDTLGPKLVYVNPRGMRQDALSHASATN